MTTLRIVTDIGASPARVWRALTAPGEVRAWDGAIPLDVPDDYPKPGQHARWRVAIGPRALVLHDRVRRVDEGVCLQSDIAYGFIRLDETYLVQAGEEPGTTRLLTIVGIDASPAVFRPVAERVAAPAVRAAMRRLAAHCQQ